MWSTKSSPQAGMPSMVLSDGPHGVRFQQDQGDHLGVHHSVPATCFPSAAALGSAWDSELARRAGQAVGREARALGVNVLLGPGINIKRSPLCGRNFEYFSEDPLLSGVLGTAFAEGVQSTGTGACVKHFAANNQETDRMRVSADVDERTLREIYLSAFERVVTQARPAAVMAAYNKVNGIPATEHRWLLTTVLREEWGFAGLVVSDWGAVTDPVAALAAGLDLDMPGGTGKTGGQVVAAVHDGRLAGAVVDRSLRRLRDAAAATAIAGDLLPVDVNDQHRLAREIAADCLVLLKNEAGALPLSASAAIAVIGQYATTPRYQGGGSSHVNATRVDSPVEELRAQLPGARITDHDGVDPTAAAAVGAAAEVAVIFAGLPERDESEGFDREHISLPADQTALITAVAQAARRTVVVLFNGGVVSVEGWHDKVDAILEAWLPGQAAGGAIADVLTGRVNPSGRLSETIPVRLNDTPSYLNFPGEAGHVRYGEGVMVGYRYYETADVAVRYPFGHGLSYTTFEHSDLMVTATGPDSARVSVRVTNTGDRSGKDVVQVYVAAPPLPVRAPARELRGFAKVSLEAGESAVVTLELDRRAFAFYDINAARWAVTAGTYRVQVGRSAHEVTAEAELDVTGDQRPRPLTLDSTVGEWFAHPAVGPALNAVLADGMSEEQARAAQENQDMLKMVESMMMRQFLSFLPVPVPDADLDRLIELSAQPASCT
ncbi:beta-glucosidase [Trebonia kvetii]|uniref:Exo-alpha-(1->6)-L-arabinopyranosidase n=2 Tax=Trebonia kvetii TaxID=2480626 RepID=A0A6P2BX28_9ACTN|nr:beta-glucosidase [Trebonia kvetii]